MKIIILAGGSGTRLWPISRKNYPKQFLTLKGQKQSLFQQAVQRSLQLVDFSDVYIVTSEGYQYLVKRQLEEMEVDPVVDNILLEPVAKNTLPAITYAVTQMSSESDHTIVVFSSDHVIKEEDFFIYSIKQMAQHIPNGCLLLFGIKPDKPHTGYGYIHAGSKNLIQQKIDSNGNALEVYKVNKFIEKPDELNAKKYFEAGYLWNSGMFMFSSKTFKSELEHHALEVYEAFSLLNSAASFEASPNISIDYGLLEKSTKVAVLPLQITWSDLGSFDSLYEQYPHDKHNNTKFHDEILIDSNNNFLYTDSEKAVALIGVNDLIVIQEKDALLISKKKQSQKVKEVVEILKKYNNKVIDEHLTTHRPWGSYTILEEGSFYKIKRITVLPGKKLSYQYHHHRSEHWVVVKGTATVVIDVQESKVLSGESTFVKAGCKHRLANLDNTELQVIEVQLGEYLEEDDIVRLEDDFGRVCE